MVPNRPRRDVIELAKPIRADGLVRGMAGDDAHDAISRRTSMLLPFGHRSRQAKTTGLLASIRILGLGLVCCQFSALKPRIPEPATIPDHKVPPTVLGPSPYDY